MIDNKKITIAVNSTNSVEMTMPTKFSQQNKVYAVDIIPEKVEKINKHISSVQGMNIIVIHIGEIYKYPPVISLLNILSDLKIQTTVITTRSVFVKNKIDNIKFEVLPFCYEKLSNPIFKFFNIFRARKQIDNIIDKLYDENTIIWITYNVSLKNMNLIKLLKRRYVIQLMELEENLVYFKKLPLKMNAKKIANNALAVIVPEYNRAHITKAWWDLKELPYVLSNKPYYDITISRYSRIDDKIAYKTFEKLKGKKIILYQGIISKERPLIPFIKAINKLGSEYAFVVMSSQDNIYGEIESSNYYYIPFIKPPKHLQITSNAYIGILSYSPTDGEFSKLNALFCAPNKVYEYAMFGIPMIGNDNPGLRFLFETSNCGKCLNNFTEIEIQNAILEIENNYSFFSQKSKDYYIKTDNKKVIKKILENVRHKTNENN